MTVDPVLVDKKTITVKYTDWGEYIYYASFIVSFGYRGKPTNDTNLRIRTIWADGQVIYFKDTAASPARVRPGLNFDFRRGTEDQTPFGSGSMAYRGQILLYFIRYNLGTSPSGLPAITAEFEDTDGTLTIAEVMETLAIRAGFEEDMISTFGLEQYEAIGYILNSQSTLESVATDLGYLYDFSMTEYAGTITFRHSYDEFNNIVITGTIPEGKLAVLNEGAEDQQIDIIQRGSDNNQPLTLSATYYDYDMFYDPGLQTVNRNSGPLRTQNSNLSVNLSIPIVAHGDEIKSRLLAALYRQWEGKNGHSLRLPPEFLYLDAGDVASWTSYGNTYTGQLVKVTLNADFSQSVSVNERTAVYNPVPMSTETPSAPDVVVQYNQATGLLLDIPDVSEDQEISGLLNLRVALGPAFADEPYFGARLDMTPTTQPTNWAPVFVGNTPTLIANLSFDPDPDATQIEIDIEVMTIERLDAALPGDLVVFGSPGYYEICSFEGYIDNGSTATILLTRGLFGTEDLINTHNDGQSRFVFYDDTTPINYPVAAYRDYTQYLWRIVAAFQPLTEANSTLWVPQGNSRKPYSPDGITVFKNLDGDILISWSEHVRFGGEPPPTTFSIDIYTPDGTEVLRRFQNITTTMQSYFLEEQVNDGTEADSVLFVVVYQNNLTHVGRGFPSGGPFTIEVESYLSGFVEADPLITGELGPIPMDLEGTIDSDPVFEGELSVAVSLEGVIESDPEFIGLLDGGMLLMGEISPMPEFIAFFAVPYILDGEVNANPVVTGNLFMDQTLSGTINSNPSFEGDLFGGAAFAGLIDSDPELTGTLTIVRELAGTIESNPVFTGHLITGAFDGLIDADPVFEGLLNLTLQLAGTVDADPELSASFTVGARLSGTVNANPSLVGQMLQQHMLGGTINSNPDVDGNLTVIRALVGTINANPSLTGELSTVPANALTLNGELLTLNGEILTLGP